MVSVCVCMYLLIPVGAKAALRNQWSMNCTNYFEIIKKIPYSTVQKVAKIVNAVFFINAVFIK